MQNIISELLIQDMRETLNKALKQLSTDFLEINGFHTFGVPFGILTLSGLGSRLLFLWIWSFSLWVWRPCNLEKPPEHLQHAPPTLSFAET